MKAGARLTRLARRIGWSLHYHGAATMLLTAIARVLPMLRRSRWYIEWKTARFDRRFGVDTADCVPIAALGMNEEQQRNAVQYTPTSAVDFGVVLAELNIDYKEFVFVDFGSGKGRAVLMASEFPFKEIVGVELSESLHAQACENVARYRSRSQRCSHIKLVSEDASTFLIPDSPLVVYFFNPFGAAIMSSVIGNIGASWERRPRKIIVIYLNPVHEALLAEHGAFAKKRLAGGDIPIGWVTYEMRCARK